MPLQLYKIATVEVGSGGASTIDFTSIPQGYTDLKLVLSSRVPGTNGTFYVRFNNDTTEANYSYKRLNGDGSTATSTTNSGHSYFLYANLNSYTANTFSSSEMYVPNYTSSTAKSINAESVLENNATATNTWMIAGLWSGTAAISRITLTPVVEATVDQYTSATLYGIL
jgi:hypothetical protein